MPDGESRLAASRRLTLVAAGFTTVVPIMKFTATGFSFVCLILVLVYFGRLENRRAGLPLLLAFLGTVAYVMSSLVNSTSLMAPNVPAFAAYGLYLCGLLVLTSTLAEVFAVMVGVSLGTMGFYAVLGTALTADGLLSALWKYGFAPAVTLLVLYVLAQSRRPRPLIGCSALLLLAVVSIALNFRSHALICVAAALLVMIDHFRRQPVMLPIKLAIIAVVGVAVSKTLEYAAQSGLLGSALTDKVEMQATQHVPAILVGRTEPPLSISAIIDHPLLGWGYANNISSGVVDRAYQLAVDIGFDPSYPFKYIWFLPDGSVSLHSILLGSWAEGGVVAVLLPFWLLWACLTLIRFAHRHRRWTVMLVFLGIQGIWDLLFSPWSYNLPVVYAVISIAALMVAADGRGDGGRRGGEPLRRRKSAESKRPTPTSAPAREGWGDESDVRVRAGENHPKHLRPSESAADSTTRRRVAPAGGRRRRDAVGPPPRRAPRHAAPERTSS